MYGCESWIIKKAVLRRIDAFWLWYWRRFLRVPWTARRSNQSILKEINSEYSLEGLMLKLELQYFSHLMRRANSLEKTLILGKTEGKRRRGQQRIRWLDSITDSVNMNLSNLQEILNDGGAWHAAVHGVAKSQTQMSNWTATTVEYFTPPWTFDLCGFKATWRIPISLPNSWENSTLGCDYKHQPLFVGEKLGWYQSQSSAMQDLGTGRKSLNQPRW